MPTERRRQVTDVRALRALANPVRYRIFGHLMAFGSQTASECAAVVGATPSNCSYHLRELARFGLVERVDDGAADGRERPWRPTATGFSYQRSGGGSCRSGGPSREPALLHAGIDDDAALAHEAAERHDALSPAWQQADGICDVRAPHHGRASWSRWASRRRPDPPVHRPHPRRRAAGRRAGARRCSAPSRCAVTRDRDDGQAPGGRPSPLRNPNFARLWVAGLVSDLGDWMLLIGLPVFVFQLTGSALTTATVFVVEIVPALLVGQVGGVLVDRSTAAGSSSSAASSRRSSCSRCSP